MSQRNGERTPPDEPGIYEFFGKRYGKHLGAKNVTVEVVRNFGLLEVYEGYGVGLDHYEGRWWGPKEHR